MPPSSTKNLSSSARVIPVPLVAPSTCIAAPDTLSAVVMVASLESAIAADPLMSAFTMTFDEWQLYHPFQLINLQKSQQGYNLCHPL